MEDFHWFFGSNAINIASGATATAAAGPTTDVIAVSPPNNSPPKTMGSINTRVVSGQNKQKDTLRNKTKQFLFDNNNVLSIYAIILLNEAFNEMDMDEWPLSKDKCSIVDHFMK